MGYLHLFKNILQMVAKLFAQSVLCCTFAPLFLFSLNNDKSHL